MSIKPALWSMITTNPAVSALIGTRLYPDSIPQDAPLPAVAYQTVSTSRGYTQDGPDGIAEPRIQFTVDAPTRAQAEDVAAALKNLLSGYRGKISGKTIGAIFLENEYDGYNLSSETVVVRQDYRISYTE